MEHHSRYLNELSRRVEELKELNTALRFALECTRTAVVVCTTGRRVIAASSSAQKILAEKDGLEVREGRLLAPTTEGCQSLGHAIRHVVRKPPREDGQPTTVRVQRPSGLPAYHLMLNAQDQPDTETTAGARHVTLFIHDPAPNTEEQLHIPKRPSSYPPGPMEHPRLPTVPPSSPEWSVAGSSVR